MFECYFYYHTTSKVKSHLLYQSFRSNLTRKMEIPLSGVEYHFHGQIPPSGAKFMIGRSISHKTHWHWVNLFGHWNTSLCLPYNHCHRGRCLQSSQQFHLGDSRQLPPQWCEYFGLTQGISVQYLLSTLVSVVFMLQYFT